MSSHFAGFDPMSADAAASTGQKQPRGKPWPKGVSGNPKGRKLGSRHRASIAAAALLDGDAEALTRKAVEMALEGDTTALRLCLERICAPRRDRPVCFALPALETAADAPRAMGAIAAAVAIGDLTASEAGDLSKMVGEFSKALEVADLERRVAELEARAP